MNPTTCLLVYAHCDDELLWGHPWLCRSDIQKKVLICCSDKNNPERQSYRRGEEALAAVCSKTGVLEHRVLSDFHSEFYRLRTRGPGSGPLLKDWWETASDAVREMSADCEYIVTHNPWGEYGHLDHNLVRRMVLETANRDVLCTSARVETSTWPVGSPHGTRPLIRVETPKSTFDALKDEYVSRQCWTWSREEPLNVIAIK